LLLLEQQDRSLWDAESIHLGVSYLHQPARGDVFSRYHAEAALAAEHCLAPSYAETRWDEITRLYQLLDSVAPSRSTPSIAPSRSPSGKVRERASRCSKL
jgi:RNA polymerase sigma-70 factor (ECF subfamily)